MPPQAVSESATLENVALPAKLFLPASETEFEAVVSELSCDGATLAAQGAFQAGTELVLYVEGFDRFSASIVRTGREMRVKFHCSPMKRERTAAKIRAYKSGETLPQTGLRAAPRSSLSSARVFQRQNGTNVEFEVIDISLLGAGLRTRCRPPIGEIITIGTTEGRVARYLDDGIAIEFIRPQLHGSPRLD